MNLEPQNISMLEDPVASRRTVLDITGNLKRAQTSLKIYAGEAHWAIFDHPEMLRTLRELKRNKVTVQVVVGPVISRGGGSKSPEIVNLAKERVVELYYRTKRGSCPHFMIIDDQIALAEKTSHEPLLPLHDRCAEEISRSTNPEKFDEFLKEFTNKATKENFVTDPTNRYLILRSSEIREAVGIAKQRGKNYDDLTAPEIAGLIKEIHASRERTTEQFNKSMAFS